MAKYSILFNPHAGNGTCETKTMQLKDILSGNELVFSDMTKINDYKAFLSGIEKDTVILISGGDGTLNRFINDTRDIHIENEIKYFPAGSGNDFYHDVRTSDKDEPITINKYLENLPEVTINGKNTKFLNGIGYGIDGYCCEMGDAMRAEGKQDISYSGIAIKGLLFHYKPTDAVITIDGKKYEYKKVWLAPSMNGRFYGGGMMPTPEQDRLKGRISFPL